MSPTPYTWVLLGSTFLLSALWAAVLLVLVRVRDGDTGERGHMGVELAWAVIPALLVLSVVVPALQSATARGEVPGPGGVEMVEADPASVSGASVPTY